jgi:hypothetical protein
MNSHKIECIDTGNVEEENSELDPSGKKIVKFLSVLSKAVHQQLIEKTWNSVTHMKVWSPSFSLLIIKKKKKH